MRRQLTLFFFGFVFSLMAGYALLAERTSEIRPGAKIIELAGRCELIYFNTNLQPVYTLILACPRTDVIRL